MKKIIFFLHIYKIYLVSTQGYNNTGVDVLKIRKTSKIWPSMKDIGSGVAVTNIPDLVIKEIRGIYGKKRINKRRN